MSHNLLYKSAVFALQVNLSIVLSSVHSAAASSQLLLILETILTQLCDSRAHFISRDLRPAALAFYTVTVR